jgi:parvulin-like peptidyl-prolyl isomerase
MRVLSILVLPILVLATVATVPLRAAAKSAAPARQSRVKLDRIVAVVGDDIILASELRRTMFRHPIYQESMSALPAGASPEAVEVKRREVEAKVLDELVDLALFRGEAVKFDIRVTDKDVERATLDVARQYGLSIEELRKQVEGSEEYGSWPEYQGELRDQILQFKVPHYLATWSVSEAQVREHYRKLTRDESAKVRVVQFSFTPSSQESADRDKAFARAQAIGRRLRSGEDAKELGEQTPSSALQKAIGRGDIAPALEDAIFDAKDGAVVGPIASGKGYVVFKVLEHLESAALSYDEAKARIREQLESEAFFKAQAELKQQLRAKAHIDIRL